MCMDDSNGKRCIACDIIKGLATIGAVAGTAFFLFKTKKGEEVRKKVGEWGEEAKEKAGEVGEELSEKSKDLIDEATKAKEELREKVGELTDEKRVELEEKLEGIKVQAGELWEKVQGFSKDVKKSAEKRFGAKKMK